MYTQAKFKNNLYFLSNFYPVDIIYKGQVYPSVEHAYQSAKTEDINIKRLFESRKLSAKQARAEGKQIHIDLSYWKDIKDSVMYELIRIKFLTYPELKDKLLNTRDSDLVEENWWHDNYWGNCICERCKNKRGLNKLGNILLRVKSELMLFQDLC